MPKMKIIFDGFEELTKQIEKAGRQIKPAVDEALLETQKIIQQKVTAAASPYVRKGGGKGYSTGAIYKAILQDVHPEWKGTVATIDVGFDLTKRGGVHSIFLMYGTKAHIAKNQYGTPRKAGAKMTQIRADKNIFNAIMGSQTKKEIADAQEKILRNYLSIGG